MRREQEFTECVQRTNAKMGHLRYEDPMSKQGMTIARAYGDQLPEFQHLAEAERELFAMRDSLLDTLKRAAQESAQLQLNESPESLKALEGWYFHLLTQSNNLASQRLDRDTLERAIKMYFGAVVVANAPSFKWFVHEFAFGAGRYEIGVRDQYCQLMLTMGSNLEVEPNNKRHQSLYRRFRRYCK